MVKKNDTVCGGDGLAYYVQYKGYPHYRPVPVKCEEIRPRAKTVLAFADLLNCSPGLHLCYESIQWV